MKYIIWNEKDRIRNDSYCGDHRLEEGDIVYLDAEGVQCYAPWPKLKTVYGSLFCLIKLLVVVAVTMGVGVMVAYLYNLAISEWLENLTITLLVVAVVTCEWKKDFLIPRYCRKH